MRQDFWIEKRWPADAPDFTFLGRAIDRVGTALFPGEWDGGEFTADGEHWVPGSWFAANRATRAHVNERLKSAFPDYVPRHRTLSPPSLNSLRRAFIVEEPSPTDWLRGVELLKEETAKIGKQLVRKFAAMRTLAEGCAGGTIISAARPIQGGLISVLPAEVWQTEVWDQRFHFCQMQPAEPYRLGSCAADRSDKRYSYIFIANKSLAAFEKAQSSLRTPLNKEPLRPPSEKDVRSFLLELKNQDPDLTEAAAEVKLASQFGAGAVPRQRRRALMVEIFGKRRTGPRGPRNAP